jgi:hypothetical protein
VRAAGQTAQAGKEGDETTGEESSAHGSPAPLAEPAPPAAALLHSRLAPAGKRSAAASDGSGDAPAAGAPAGKQAAKRKKKEQDGGADSPVGGAPQRAVDLSANERESAQRSNETARRSNSFIATMMDDLAFFDHVAPLREGEAAEGEQPRTPSDSELLHPSLRHAWQVRRRASARARARRQRARWPRQAARARSNQGVGGKPASEPACSQSSRPPLLCSARALAPPAQDILGAAARDTPVAASPTPPVAVYPPSFDFSAFDPQPAGPTRDDVYDGDGGLKSAVLALGEPEPLSATAPRLALSLEYGSGASAPGGGGNGRVLRDTATAACEIVADFALGGSAGDGGLTAGSAATPLAGLAPPQSARPPAATATRPSDWVTTHTAVGAGGAPAESGGAAASKGMGAVTGLSPVLTPANIGDFLVDAF